MFGVTFKTNRLAWFGLGIAGGVALAALLSPGGFEHAYGGPHPGYVFAILVTVLSLVLLFFADRNRRRPVDRWQDDGFLATVLDNTADGIIVIDPDGIVHVYNAAAERMFGYSAAEVVDGNVAILLLPEERAKHDGYLRKSTVFEPKIVGTQRTLRGRRKDGTTVPVEISVSRMVGEAGPLFIGVCHDISARLKAEEDLRNSEERLQDAIESLQEGFAMFDAEDRLVLCNTRYREMYDLIADKLVPGARFADLLRIGVNRGQFPEANNDVEGWIADRMRRHEGTGYQLERQLPNGRWLKIEERRTRRGNIVGVRTDITEIRKREQQLRESEERYRHLVDLLPDGVMVHDDGVIVFANDAMAKILDVKSRDDLIGRREIEFVPPEEREAVRHRRDAASRPGTMDRRETAYVRDDGSRVDIERLLAVINWEGRTASLTLLREITERKRTEKAIIEAQHQAETANKVKSAFLANMSHELRTPLNAIIGFSDLMASETFGPIEPEPYRNYPGHILGAGQHLLELINDILDLSKVEAGSAELQEEAIVIPDLVRAATLLVQGRANKGEVRLAVDLQQNLPPIRADLRKMKQILVNILSNAVKFTDARGSVTMQVRCEPGSGHVFRIADTGVGMARDDIPKALSPFGQVEIRSGRSEEGTGLGLPLTKKLVELHGGRLELESAPGEGTAVTLFFPADRIVPTVRLAASGDGG